jgi:predicted DNA-binding transcriptional regulator YafY
MGKIGNALLMLRLLESGKKYTIKELSEKLEVTPRMIKVYKEELDKSGIYIDTIRGKYGGYVYHKKHDYHVSFDYLDLDSIESILDKLNEEECEKITITLEKLRAIVIYSADEKRNIKIDKRDLERKYIIISRAIKNGSEITFKFHNKLRKFIPYSFTYYKDFIYVTGYSILEDDIKTLNLSNIKELYD